MDDYNSHEPPPLYHASEQPLRENEQHPYTQRPSHPAYNQWQEYYEPQYGSYQGPPGYPPSYDGGPYEYEGHGEYQQYGGGYPQYPYPGSYFSPAPGAPPPPPHGHFLPPGGSVLSIHGIATMQPSTYPPHMSYHTPYYEGAPPPLPHGAPPPHAYAQPEWYSGEYYGPYPPPSMRNHSSSGHRAYHPSRRPRPSHHSSPSSSSNPSSQSARRGHKRPKQQQQQTFEWMKSYPAKSTKKAKSWTQEPRQKSPSKIQPVLLSPSKIVSKINDAQNHDAEPEPKDLSNCLIHQNLPKARSRSEFVSKFDEDSTCLWIPPPDAEALKTVDTLLEQFQSLKFGNGIPQESLLATVMASNYILDESKKQLGQSVFQCLDLHNLDDWKENEIHAFEMGICKYGKQFNRISSELKTKTRTECVSFYYRWKKTERGCMILRRGMSISAMKRSLICTMKIPKSWRLPTTIDVQPEVTTSRSPKGFELVKNTKIASRIRSEKEDKDSFDVNVSGEIDGNFEESEAELDDEKDKTWDPETSEQVDALAEASHEEEEEEEGDSESRHQKNRPKAKRKRESSSGGRKKRKTRQDEPEIFNVEAIVGHRSRKSKKEFLVKWEGYGDEANTWEPEANLKNNTILLDYKKNVINKSKRRKSLVEKDQSLSVLIRKPRSRRQRGEESPDEVSNDLMTSELKSLAFTNPGPKAATSFVKRV